TEFAQGLRTSGSSLLLLLLLFFPFLTLNSNTSSSSQYVLFCWQRFLRHVLSRHLHLLRLLCVGLSASRTSYAVPTALINHRVDGRHGQSSNAVGSPTWRWTYLPRTKHTGVRL
ncbi:hypothetical protein M758_10G152200, partial [Ceratodon purpureus]